jgi:hypothetical protein
MHSSVKAGRCSHCADYPTNQTTFYDVLRARGYSVMTTGKDDLTKATQLGSKMGGSPPIAPAEDWPYPGCPQCKPGDGQWHLKELGFTDAIRYSGKMDVVDKPEPHEVYSHEASSCFLLHRVGP